jgi:hypothetical protein
MLPAKLMKSRKMQVQQAQCGNKVGLRRTHKQPHDHCFVKAPRAAVVQRGCSQASHKESKPGPREATGLEISGVLPVDAPVEEMVSYWAFTQLTPPS